MNIAIIYHDADFDGLLSREVCLFHLKRNHPHAVIHDYGWDYGRPLPNCQLKRSFEEHDQQLVADAWENYDQIYIVDLSVDELMKREDLKPKIIWIDHHKSAIQRYGNLNFFGYRLDGVAACRLCWQWFTVTIAPEPKSGVLGILKQKEAFERGVDEPRLLYLAGIYDVWDKDNPDFEDAKVLQFGLRALSPDGFRDLVDAQFDGCSDDANSLLQDAISTGVGIKRYCDRNNFDYAKTYAHTLEWEGLRFCALNIGQRGNSDLLLGGIDPMHHDACFAWRYTGDGSCMISLYHIAGKEHHDLSVIATKHGGGGHRGACGFRKSLEDLDIILHPKRV